MTDRMTGYGYVKPNEPSPGHFTDADVQRLRRLPAGMLAALRQVQRYMDRADHYGMTLEEEAQQLLRELYGRANPGEKAEAEYQRARRG